MFKESKFFGEQILCMVQRHNIHYFKAYQIRKRTGLKFGQFNLGLQWLRNNGIIEKTGGTYSCWRVIND